MNFKSFITLMLLVTSFNQLAYSQKNKTKADELFKNSDWEKAAASYDKHLKSNPNDSVSWYNLGVCNQNLQNYNLAITQFEKAIHANYKKNIAYFNIAKCYAQIGNEQQLKKLLKRSSEDGFGGWAFLKNDSIIGPYLNDATYSNIIKKMKENAYPCLTNKDNRHFDFWLGTWDVYARGGKVGVNVVTMAEGGCAIHENYSTKGSYFGQSINYFDPIDKKWHQHYVGAGGDIYNYIETNRSEGMLEFQSQFLNPNTKKQSLSKLTFTLNEDGSVRQLFETSFDDGKTWTPGFDGLYKKQQK